MNMNPLPPQAYTKDTLLKAYQWLLGQSASTREIATTPDILVSLYLKATRDGDEVLERPSIQNFKNELRNLAGMIGDLDRPQNVAVTTGAMIGAANSDSLGASVIANNTSFGTTGPVHSASLHSVPTQVSYTEKTLTASNHQAHFSAHLIESFDKGTYQMIQEVKQEFNLGSDFETVRMLIKFGYMKSKDVWK